MFFTIVTLFPPYFKRPRLNFQFSSYYTLLIVSHLLASLISFHFDPLICKHSFRFLPEFHKVPSILELVFLTIVFLSLRLLIVLHLQSKILLFLSFCRVFPFVYLVIIPFV